MGDKEIDKKDAYGYTALHRAASAHDDVILSSLLTLGANPHVISDDGHMPVHLIFENTHLVSLRQNVYLTEVNDAEALVADSSIGSSIESGVDEEHSRVICSPTKWNYSWSFPRKPKSKPSCQKVLQCFIDRGYHVDLKNSQGKKITQMLNFWKADIHPWVLRQPIKLPEFSEIGCGAMPYYSKHLLDYIRAGSDDPLAVQNTAIRAVMNNTDDGLYETALYASPRAVLALDMAFMFKDNSGAAWERLDDKLKRILDYFPTLRCQGYQRFLRPGRNNTCVFESQSALPRGHLYWTHRGQMINPLTLVVCCTVTVRRLLVTSADGCSLLPAVEKLQIPQTLKQILTLKFHTTKDV